MIKSFFKWTFRLVVGLILAGAITYGIFHLWEYSTGGKFVDYLSANSETIPLEESFTYEALGADIEKSQLILVGEIHGFHEPNKFDAHFFKYLHSNYQVRHYVAEFDYIQATLLNEYLKSGDEETLRKVLKKWAVFQGRNNQDYFDKYVELQKYYASLPEEEKFQFIGIDRIQDTNLLLEFLWAMSANPDAEIPEDQAVTSLLSELMAHTSDPDTLSLLSHIKTNVDYVQEKLGREEILFQNFSQLYKSMGLGGQRLYGYFGLTHIFQYRVNGYHPLASQIRISDLGLADKILSINFIMNDSYMVMPSSQLPGFMRDEGPYSRMPISADNMLALYMVGIKDFKRMTPNHHKSLIKMDAEDSPYENSIRLNKTIQLLPLAEKLNMDDKGKPYVQYTVFVRNSDWAEPMKK